MVDIFFSEGVFVYVRIVFCWLLTIEFHECLMDPMDYLTKYEMPNPQLTSFVNRFVVEGMSNFEQLKI